MTGQDVANGITTASQTTTADKTTTLQTRRLLACGIVAGPLFMAVALLQAFTRDGFDLGRHPISLLSLGDLGWIQIANFVVCGALYVACAVGMRRTLRHGRSGTWGPLLVAALGAGMIIAGVFVTDAGAGFPPGAPPGAPPEISWHGMLHSVGGLLSLSMTVACLVFARRFAALGRWGWVTFCACTVVAVVAVLAWPDMDSLSVRLVLGSAIQSAFVAALAVHLLRGGVPDAGQSVDDVRRRTA